MFFLDVSNAGRQASLSCYLSGKGRCFSLVVHFSVLSMFGMMKILTQSPVNERVRTFLNIF